MKHDDLNKIFGENQGYWEYRDINDEFVCYTVRYWNCKLDKKEVKPWTLQNGKWINKWFKDDENRPIYNVTSLKITPEKPILIVEGEKTTEAGKMFFPDFNVISWMGGSKAIDRVDFNYLKDKDVYLLPDNDKGGYEAMEYILDTYRSIVKSFHFIDVQNLKVKKGWDLDNLNDKDSEIEPVDIIMMVNECPIYKPVFSITSYPFLGGSEKKPYPLDVTANLNHLTSFFNIVNKWNMLKREREIIIPGKTLYNEEAANESLTLITNLAVQYKFNIRRIDKHLDAIAFENRYHPIRDWILSKPNTNPDILDDFTSILKTTNDVLSKLLFRRWLIAAIATVFNESDFRAQGVLVLQGKGGWGKTNFIASLVPHDLDAVYTGATLDPSNKDSIITLSEYWIAELGELGSTFKKSDIDKLKAYITQDKDKVRRPFAAKNSKLLRRTIFAASVNEENFLVDKTGNRRWWVLSLTEKIDLNYGFDMQQVWRAAYDLWTSGEKTYLTDEELETLNESNIEFEFLDPFEEKLDTHFDWNCSERIWMKSTEVLQRIGYDKPTDKECTKIGILLSKKNIIKGKGRLRRSYLMPAWIPNIENM